MFGEYFKELRKSKNLTQQSIADAIGKSKMLVSGIETGKNGVFLDEDLEKISRALELTDGEKNKLFFEAAKAQERLPANITKYIHGHSQVIELLEMLATDDVKNDDVARLVAYWKGHRKNV